MFFQSKKVLGLDIGSTSIKLAELDVSRRAATLTAFAMAPLPPQALVNGDFADVSAISEVVSGLFQTLQSNRKQIACSIFGNSVIVKKVSIPKMEEKMIVEQIKWEAEQYIPFDINEVNLDFRVLKSSAANAETMDLLLVAAKQESIFKYSDILKNLGKNLAIVDVAGFSLAQCFERNYGSTTNQVFALIDVGGLITNITIVDRGEIAFSRDILMGGATYTTEIEKGLGLSYNEAESMKLSAARGQAVPDELLTILNSSHQTLCEEISASLEFYLNASPGNINACYVTGGGSRTPGLLQQLETVVKAPCQKLEPFRKIRCAQKISADVIMDIADISSVALGLGLRSVGDS
jgi:type IV pilus assembly protein PilM